MMTMAIIIIREKAMMMMMTIMVMIFNVYCFPNTHGKAMFMQHTRAVTVVV